MANRDMRLKIPPDVFQEILYRFNFQGAQMIFQYTLGYKDSGEKYEAVIKLSDLYKAIKVSKIS